MMGDPMATQRHLEGAENIYVLASNRPGVIVPSGIKVVTPYAKNHG